MKFNENVYHVPNGVNFKHFLISNTTTKVPKDIKKKILEAHDKPRSNELRQHIVNNHTWEKTAERTLQGYNLALDKT